MVAGKIIEWEGNKYYLDGDGIMAENATLTYHDKKYNADEKGVLTEVSDEEQLTDEEKLFIQTIYGEADNSSEASWKAIANVIMNRVGKYDWKKYKTPAEVIKKSGLF